MIIRLVRKNSCHIISTQLTQIAILSADIKLSEVVRAIEKQRYIKISFHDESMTFPLPFSTAFQAKYRSFN